MATITKDQAVRRITESVPKLPLEDLVEVYNDIFLEERATEEEVRKNRNSIQNRIDDHIRRGLEIEEILDLWRVFFPQDRNVFYDDETNTIHLDEKEEEAGPLQYVD